MLIEMNNNSTNLQTIAQRISRNTRLLAILIDPDKANISSLDKKIQQLPLQTDFILVGGSQVPEGKTQLVVQRLKELTQLPIIIFPGHYEQISTAADAVLFLSLLSGSNPEYLVHQQIQSVDKIWGSKLEIIPTAYILIDGGKKTAVQQVSQTQALKQNQIQQIVKTALAGQFMGKKLIYLEAGSGAIVPVSPQVIRAVKEKVNIPIIVGGGIKNLESIEKAYQAGANLVVVGNAFEENQFYINN
ncbi:MAG: geranylgeranylglyceryl/heptaprenylglyceryl phosphate synthase [Bacteroidota bacterium]